MYFITILSNYERNQHVIKHTNLWKFSNVYGKSKEKNKYQYKIQINIGWLILFFIIIKINVLAYYMIIEINLKNLIQRKKQNS